MASYGGDVVINPIIEMTKTDLVYKVRNGTTRSLKATLIEILKGKSSDIDIKALDQVTFSLYPGEVLAILGKNGAGKSTMLKLIARVLPPTNGRVVVRGTVAPMIELGAGFNKELSGVENALLYSALLGKSPNEMKKRIDQIAEWAGLTAAIQLPLRTYSSGMIARLAFAVATDTRSDLILIDEVLSVGDADFRQKSKVRIKELVEKNVAMVLVTHDISSAREFASKGLLLDGGKVIKFGGIEEVIAAYQND
jgi:ABC-type polysaccharide/polyol phosphate transport system ATPase subunit